MRAHSSNSRPGFLRQVAPLLAALLLVGGIAAYLRHASQQVKPVNIDAVIVQTLPEAPRLEGWPPELGRALANAYDAVLQKDSRAAALAEMAQLYHANGFLAQAQSCYLGLMALQPRSPVWPYLMAMARLDYGAQDLVVSDLSRSLQLDPNYDLAYLRLGDAYRKQGQGQRARSVYETFLQRRPEDPWALEGLARIALANDQWAEARALLERAVAADERFAPALELLAEVCIELGDLAAAKRYRLLHAGDRREPSPLDERLDERLEQLEAYCYDTSRLRSWAAQRLESGRAEAAWKLLDRGHEVDPSDTETALAWARLLLREGAPSNAAEAAFPFAAAVAALRREGDLEAGQQLLAVGIARAPNSAPLWVEQALLRKEQGRWAEAEAALRRALEADPAVAGARFELGLLLMESRPEEGITHLEEHLRSTPDDHAARMAVGLYYVSSDQLERGIAALEALWDRDPAYPQLRAYLAAAHRQRGQALEAVGDASAATPHFQRAARLEAAE